MPIIILKRVEKRTITRVCQVAVPITERYFASSGFILLTCLFYDYILTTKIFERFRNLETGKVYNHLSYISAGKVLYTGRPDIKFNIKFFSNITEYRSSLLVVCGIQFPLRGVGLSNSGLIA